MAKNPKTALRWQYLQVFYYANHLPSMKKQNQTFTPKYDWLDIWFRWIPPCIFRLLHIKKETISVFSVKTLTTKEPTAQNKKIIRYEQRVELGKETLGEGRLRERECVSVCVSTRHGSFARRLGNTVFAVEMLHNNNAGS